MKILKQQSGSALILTVLIMASVLVVGLLTADMVVSGIKMTYNQSQSTKAYFAAEAGAERVLREINTGTYNSATCSDGQCIDFNDGTCETCDESDSNMSITLDNNSSYMVEYNFDSDAGFTSFLSVGDYLNVKRSVEVAFTCLPNCTGKDCGDDDGCGGECGKRCDTGPECLFTAGDNMVVVAGASCCDGKTCYACQPGTEWNSTECVGLNCGNGVLDAGEDCDDDNNTPDDGCSATCKWETNSFSCSDGSSLPLNAVWNLVAGYTQTCVESDGSDCLKWDYPATTPEYNETATTTACHYKCPEFYAWDSGAGECKRCVYVIADCVELQKIGNDAAYPLDSDYILVPDIAVNGGDFIDCGPTNPANSRHNTEIFAGEWIDGRGFDPIGSNIAFFAGNFNGNNKEIKDLYISRDSSSYNGLFGKVKSVSTRIIENVRLVNINIYGVGSNNTGGLVGWIDANYTIANSSTAGNDVEGYESIGGLAGVNYGTIINSHSTVKNFAGHEYSGGLVGVNNGTIKNSYATGRRSLNGSYMGGLVGENNGFVENSYATGDQDFSNVNGQYIGGLIGLNGYNGNIKDSYSTGGVAGDQYIGGFIGFNEHSVLSSNPIITNCYWDIEKSGNTVGCLDCLVACASGCTGVASLTTAEMQSHATPSNESNYNTWTFADTANADWKLDEILRTGTETSYYPCLSWQDDDTCPIAQAGTTVYACQDPAGWDETNAELCTGDDSGLSADTDKTLVSGCTDSQKCEYTCAVGYTLDAGVCQPIINCCEFDQGLFDGCVFCS